MSYPICPVESPPFPSTYNLQQCFPERTNWLSSLSEKQFSTLEMTAISVILLFLTKLPSLYQSPSKIRDKVKKFSQSKVNHGNIPFPFLSKGSSRGGMIFQGSRRKTEGALGIGLSKLKLQQNNIESQVLKNLPSENKRLKIQLQAEKTLIKRLELEKKHLQETLRQKNEALQLRIKESDNLLKKNEKLHSQLEVQRTEMDKLYQKLKALEEDESTVTGELQHFQKKLKSSELQSDAEINSLKQKIKQNEILFFPPKEDPVIEEFKE